MFGTKALEQFLDRLVELPQYCSHILQISHLHGTHPELVDFVERALARISSSSLGKDEENTYVPHDGFTAATSESSEVNSVKFFPLVIPCLSVLSNTSCPSRLFTLNNV